MEITVCKVDGKLKDMKKIKALMDRSFPPQERFPFPVLRMMTLREGFDFLAFYEKDVLIGFTYSICTENIMFLLFLAVNPHRRNQGYGSKILKFMKELEPEKTLVLNAEDPDVGTVNLPERVERLKFYKYNGFTPSGYLVKDENDTYVILTDGGTLDVREYKKALGRMTFGVYDPEVIPEEQ